MHIKRFGLSCVVGLLSLARKTPSLANHVRELSFVAVCDETKEYSPRVKALGKFASGLHTLLHPFQRLKIRGFHRQVKRAKTIVASLDQLTNLEIVWHSRADPYTPFYQAQIIDSLTSILATGWPSFSSTIHTLSLSVTLDVFPTLFPQELSTFQLPRLEVLLLDIQEYRRMEGSSFIHSLVAPFIRRHAGTLRSLGISSWFSTDHIAFYTSIGHLPLLRVLELGENVHDRNAHAHALRQFLLLHVDTLEALKWTLLTSSYWPPEVLPQGVYTQAPFDVHLPKLRELRLYFVGMWMYMLDGFQDLVEYIPKPSLRYPSADVPQPYLIFIPF